MQNLSLVNMLQELGKAYVARSNGEIGTGSREQKKRQAIDGTSTGRLNQIREFIYEGNQHSHHIM